MTTYSGVRISELPEAFDPNASDVIVLNISDQQTKKITYRNLLTNIRVKLSTQSDWNQDNKNEINYIKNKPRVYVADEYLPSLLTII